MTDKQIIIDSEDVSECIECDTDKIKDGYDALCCLTNCSCKHHPNCYYKQLKRKEQECETQQKALELQKSFLDHSEWKLKRAEQECEMLKEEKQGLIKDWEEKKNLGYEIACKNEKLKETLAEIKEIAEEDCKQCFEIDGFSKPDDCGICPYNKILQKISEVINE